MGKVGFAPKKMITLSTMSGPDALLLVDGSAQRSALESERLAERMTQPVALRRSPVAGQTDLKKEEDATHLPQTRSCKKKESKNFFLDPWKAGCIHARNCGNQVGTDAAKAPIRQQW